MRGDGPSGLAAPLSVADLAAAHPLWAADVARLAPWREVVVADAADPAAGTWFAACGDAGQVSTPVVVVGACDSSLDVGWALSAAGCLPPFASVLAVTQRQGRGQLRRGWESPPGNLYAALAWPADPGNLGAMAPVLAGYGLAEALTARGFPALVKWPNDVLLDDRKVGGILVEDRDGRALAGIGLNCASAPDAARLRRDHAAEAGALAMFGELPGLVTLWAGLVQSVQTCYRQCVTASGCGECSRLVAPRVAWLGREVVVRESGCDAFQARIVGLAEDGGLRLRRVGRGPGPELTLHCGSISLL